MIGGLADALVAEGRIADLILLVLLIEGGVLVYLWRNRGQGVPPGRLIPALLAGAALVLALRAALSGADPIWVLVFAAAGGVAHLMDIRARWR